MHSLKSVLALGAHPDDLELGCGATLAKLASQGVQITAVIFSEGGRGGGAEYDRVGETRQALRALGVGSVIQRSFPDTRLHEHLNEIIADIELHVRELEPQRVYTMFDGDRH